MSIITMLYFFVPAYVANMAPPFLRKLRILDYPLDFGRTFKGKRLFGSNKTFRGLIGGSLLAMIAFWLQQLAHINGFTAFSQVRYEQLSVLWGFAIGFSALVGDAVESFFKRQLGIAPGQRLLFWDQLDFMFAALIVTVPFWLGDWLSVLGALLVIFVLTVVVQRIGYWLGIKSDPW